MWIFCNWLTALFTLVNILGHATSWRLLTIFLCWSSYTGGIALFGAHMLFESARNEASASACAVNFWAVSAFTFAAFEILFAGNMIWFWLLFALCLVVATF